MDEVDSSIQTVLHHTCNHCTWSWRMCKAAEDIARTCDASIINICSTGYALYFTPLVLLCDGAGQYSHQRCNIAKVLIERRADLETCDQHGNTPFLIAASAGFVDMMKLLFPSGANIHAQNTCGVGARGRCAMSSSTANEYAASINVMPSWKSQASTAVRSKSNGASQKMRGHRNKMYWTFENSGAFLS